MRVAQLPPLSSALGIIERWLVIRIAEKVVGRNGVITIAPTRDSAKALWSLFFCGFCFYGLGLMWFHALTAKDRMPWIAVAAFSFVAFLMAAMAVVNACWIWAGTWQVDIGETKVLVKAALFGKAWTYEYQRIEITNVRIRLFKRKGAISGRRIVGDSCGKLINLTPLLTQSEGERVLARLNELGLK